jgi:hypothetical protein
MDMLHGVDLDDIRTRKRDASKGRESQANTPPVASILLGRGFHDEGVRCMFGVCVL